MPASFTGKLADPAFRTGRASSGGRAAHSVDAHIRAVVRAAGRLTDEQIAELRALLPPVPAARGGDHVPAA